MSKIVNFIERVDNWVNKNETAFFIGVMCGATYMLICSIIVNFLLR